MFRIVFIFSLMATALALPQASTHTSRIVNGTLVPAGKYPEMVSIKAGWNGDNFVHLCGATILNENWVLTTAKCLVDFGGTTELAVLSGTLSISDGTGTFSKIMEVIKHENYNEGTAENDIAVVADRFEWDLMVQPVNLPLQGQETEAGTLATVIGWGKQEYNGYMMADLHEINYWISNDQECSDQMSFLHEILSTNICARFNESGIGICTNDEGGPLYVNGAQVGIASWLIFPCGTQYNPTHDVYTEVSAYVDWINSKIN